MQPARSAIVVAALVLLATSPNGGAADPPAQPMVLHGVALVAGAPVAAGTALTLSVDGQPLCTTVRQDCGEAYYWLTIAPTPVQPIRLVSLGEHNLSTLAPLAWETGTVVRQDLLINCDLTAAPQIVTASARLAGDTWTLACQFPRLDQTAVSPSRLTYLVRWYVVKPPARSTEPPAGPGVLLSEGRYPGDGVGAVDASATVTRALTEARAHLLALVVDTAMENGHRGPPGLRLVPITLTTDQL